MSAVRMLVLGVLRNLGQAHGYQVRRELLTWRADAWAHVDPGSIYQALRTLALVMAVFVGIFAVAIVVINVMLRRAVVQPIGLMAALANKISNNEITAGGFELAELEDVAKRSDERSLARRHVRLAAILDDGEVVRARDLHQ